MDSEDLGNMWTITNTIYFVFIQLVISIAESLKIVFDVTFSMFGP